MKTMHANPQLAELGERIAATRFYDIAKLCQQVKGGSLGFDFNRKWMGPAKEEWGSTKRAFAHWAITNLDANALLNALPEFEKEAQEYYERNGKAKPNIAKPKPEQAKEESKPEEENKPLTVGVEKILEAARQTAQAMDAHHAQAQAKAMQEIMDRLNLLNNARPVQVTVKYPDKEATNALGVQHRDFLRLLKLCSLRPALNVWMTGPAGSGKTTAASNAAKALDIPFYFTGAIDNEYKLLGFTDAHGRVVRTSFREAYENGGVFLFDEIDGSAPGALLALNAALANGTCDFPDGNIVRHKDCVIIAAANTWGSGATHEYVGRAKLDSASLDRFVMLAWDYDDELEKRVAGNDNWVQVVHTVRARIREAGIKHIVSPRASYVGAQMLAAGVDKATVLECVIRKGLPKDTWENVARGIK